MFGRVRGLPCPAPHQIRRPPRLVFARYQPPSPPAHRPSASAACRPPTRPPCLGASAVLPCPASFSFELRPPRRVFVGLVRAASSLEPGPLLSGVPLQASVHAPLRSSLHWCGAVLASPRLCPACSCFRLQPLGRVFVSSGSVWLRMLLTPIWSCTPSRPLALRDSALLHGRCAAVCSVCSRGARVKCRICSQPGPLYAPRSRQYVNQPGSSAYAASQDLYMLPAASMSISQGQVRMQPARTSIRSRPSSCTDSYVLCHQRAVVVCMRVRAPWRLWLALWLLYGLPVVWLHHPPGLLHRVPCVIALMLAA
jgi:hypothetical protein